MPLAAHALAARLEPSLVDGGRLLERLARRLDAVPYCQWKGHANTGRWGSGEGDVDLLVDPQSMSEFRRIATELGFKTALLPGERQLPGIEHYFGYDPLAGGLLHLHVHYRLVLGDFWRTIFRIPVERQVLDTSVRGNLFRVPSPEYQFLIFVLRMVLRQRGRLPGSRWFRGVRIQLDDLEDRCNRTALAGILDQYIPAVGAGLFQRCVRWLKRECGPLDHVMAPLQLRRRLRTHARRPQVGGFLAASVEKALPGAVAQWIVDARMRPEKGGIVVALVGGDGCGKTTCTRELERWLSASFATMRGTLGNPPRSLLTFAVGGALRLEQRLYGLLGWESPQASTLELFRYACAARDCHRLYQKVQRFAAAGGIAICERYPVSELPTHVGPCIPRLLPATPSRLSRLLRTVEGGYYQRMVRPDLLLVLRLDPELAVIRKQDEPADYVRTRNRHVWETEWQDGKAEVVDASQPLDDVLERLKARVWQAL